VTTNNIDNISFSQFLGVGVFITLTTNKSVCQALFRAYKGLSAADSTPNKQTKRYQYKHTSHCAVIMSSFLSPEQQAMFDRALLAAGKLTSPTSSYNNLAAEADSQSGSKRRHHHHHNHHHRSHRSSSKDETAASALTKKSPLKAVLKCGKGAWVLTDGVDGCRRRRRRHGHLRRQRR